jgi:hypothetical protein
MAIAKCPECQEEVSLPTASAQATVQCPLCDGEYAFSEISDSLPPALIVLEDPQAESEAARDLTLAPEEPVVSNSAFAFDEEAAPGKSQVERTAARRASSGSPLKTIVQVFLGGALALPLAQLVLWHLPEEPRDPVGLGKMIYAEQSLSFLRAIVPEALNESGESSEEQVEAAQEDEDRPLTNPLQQSTGFDVGPMDEVPLGATNPLENPFGGKVDSENNKPTIDEIAAQAKPVGPAPLSPTEYIRESYVFQNIVIKTMFEQAQDSLAQWDDLEEDASDNLRQIERKELFLSLGQLASGVTYQDPQASESFESVEQAFLFFSELAGRSEIMEVVNVEFENRLRTQQSPRTGVLFTAHSLGEEESISGYQRLLIQPEGTEIEVPLIYSPELAKPVAEDTPCLVLGSLIRRPRRDVKNFLGTDEFVVVFGAAVPLATSPQ